jgi:hypothetical protein
MEQPGKKYEDHNMPLPPKFEWKYLVYAILIFSQVATWGLILYDKNRTSQTFQIQKKQINYLDSARQEVQKLYDASLVMIEEKTSTNLKLDSMLRTKDNEIVELKDKISVMLKKEVLTKAEIDSARRMVKRLNERVFNYLVENEQLKKENQKLVDEKSGVISENKNIKSELSKTKKTVSDLDKSNKELNKTIELAATLSTSNIQLMPINVKSSGKEVATSKAAKANVMRISFDINENWVAASGPKKVYVCMYGPDDKPVMIDENDPGTFVTNDGEEKVYSSKVMLNYIQGRKHNIKIDWKNKDKFVAGTYRINIYHNGLPIGEGTVELK